MLRARVRLKLFSLSLRYKCFSLSLSLSLSLILCISRRRTKESRVSLSCFFCFLSETPKGTPFFFTWSLRRVARNIWSLPWLGAGTGRLWYIYINKHPREQRVGENDSGGEKNARARKSGKRFLCISPRGKPR